MRRWLGSERARWPLLSERVSAAAGAGRKAISALLSRRPLPRPVGQGRGPGWRGGLLSPEGEGPAAISGGAKKILRRRVSPPPAAGPVLRSGLSLPVA